jgi:hypothetical protein
MPERFAGTVPNRESGAKPPVLVGGAIKTPRDVDERCQCLARILVKSAKLGEVYAEAAIHDRI